MQRTGWLLTLCWLIVLNPAQASSAPFSVTEALPKLAQLQQLAEAQTLWRNQQWLNLVHYKGAGEAPDDFHSSARDPRFFLTEQGRTDPQAELNAMIAALYAPANLGDEHPRCRFSARSNWLADQLRIDESTLPTLECKQYQQWRKDIPAASVSMAFPAYHLNSPSSMYGHTLLRLDAADAESRSQWLSTAISFGAEINQQDNALLYAYKGLVGGYAGRFVVDYYYKKIQEYNRMEHRDIWEYQLNLSAQETEQLIRHVWELQGIDFDYFYFDENCSYRLLELLEVARPGIDLTSEFKIAAIPVDTVRVIKASGLIQHTSFRASQSTQLRARLDQLTPELRRWVSRLADDSHATELADFSALSANDQALLIDLAYRLLRYRETGKPRNPVTAKRSHQLLLKLNAYRDSQLPDAEIAPSQPPESGHASKRIRLSLGTQDSEPFIDVGYKMSFHDLEDNQQGFLRGAQINIGRLDARIFDDGSIRLEQLDLVDIFSLTPRDEFFDPLSWRVTTGFERQLTLGEDRLVYHVTGGSGGAWSLGPDSMVYLLGIGRLEMNRGLARVLEPALGFASGVLMHFSASTARLEASGEQFLDDMRRARVTYQHNFILDTQHSIHLGLAREWQDERALSNAHIAYQYYF